MDSNTSDPIYIQMATILLFQFIGCLLSGIIIGNLFRLINNFNINRGSECYHPSAAPRPEHFPEQHVRNKFTQTPDSELYQPQIPPRPYRRFHKQMMKTGIEMSGPAIPDPQPTAVDPALTMGTAIFTNRSVGVVAMDLNPTGFALDNIAATGAPFEKRDQVYNIYSTWVDTYISGVMAAGSVIAKLSLNPQTLPANIKDYVMLHEDAILSYDIAMFVNGTAGSLGTIRAGWVKDISKDYSLEELMRIASIDATLSATSTQQIVLRDIRRSSVYRKVRDDPEPWPGIVISVSKAITNANRDANIEFPITIFVKLNPATMLASPFNTISQAISEVPNVALSTFITTTSGNVDIAIGTPQVPDLPEEVEVFTNETPRERVATYLSSNYVDQTNIKQVLSIPMYARYDRQGNLHQYVQYLVFCYGTGPKLPAVLKSLQELGGTRVTIPPRTIASPGNKNLVVNEAVVWSNGIGIILPLFTLFGSSIDLSQPLTTLSAYDKVDSKLTPVTWDGTKPIYATQADPTQVSYLTQSTLEELGIWQIKHTVIAEGGPDTFNGAIDQESWGIQYEFKLFPMVLTGNDQPTTALPTGLATLDFVHQGTTKALDIPCEVLGPSGMTTLYKYLDSFGYSTVGGVIEIDGTAQIPFAYRNKQFVVNTTATNKIRLATKITSIRLVNVKEQDLNSLPPYTPLGYSDWVTSTKKTVRRFYKQMYAAGAFMAGGSALSSIGEAIMQKAYMDNMNKNADLNRKLQLQLMEAKNRNNLEVSRQNNQMKMEQLGASSASNQASGNGAPVLGLSNFLRTGMVDSGTQHISTAEVGTAMNDNSGGDTSHQPGEFYQLASPGSDSNWTINSMGIPSGAPSLQTPSEGSWTTNSQGIPEGTQQQDYETASDITSDTGTLLSAEGPSNMVPERIRHAEIRPNPAYISSAQQQASPEQRLNSSSASSYATASSPGSFRTASSSSGTYSSAVGALSTARAPQPFTAPGNPYRQTSSGYTPAALDFMQRVRASAAE